MSAWEETRDRLTKLLKWWTVTAAALILMDAAQILPAVNLNKPWKSTNRKSQMRTSKNTCVLQAFFFLLTRDWNSQMQWTVGFKKFQLQNKHIMEKFTDVKNVRSLLFIEFLYLHPQIERAAHVSQGFSGLSKGRGGGTDQRGPRAHRITVPRKFITLTSPEANTEI